jgi:hypothetical protein
MQKAVKVTLFSFTHGGEKASEMVMKKKVKVK